jgi:hypothetical protein
VIFDGSGRERERERERERADVRSYLSEHRVGLFVMELWTVV